MKILAIADTHGHLPEIAPGVLSQADCIMIAGDVSPFGNLDPGYQKAWLEDVFSPWIERLGKPAYLTFGNHDFIEAFDGPPNLCFGTETVMGDVLLFSWTLRYFDFAWTADEETMSRKLDALLAAGPKPTIWLTHGPPHGVCDHIFLRGHVGSLALRDAIVKHQPHLVICGHIHEAAGIGSLGKTRIYNVSCFDPGCEWYGEPVMIEI